ncbi:MAG: cupin domain-containing protein [Candidatus Bathyarchaeia archaeon]|jgi:hypothetical protein
MRARKDELKKAVDEKELAIYEGIWGEMSVQYFVYKERFDVTPFLKGLPNNLDPCPHWGIVTKGEITLKYDGKEEKAKAGEAWYAPPGHTAIAEAGTEFWQFSPKDLIQKTNEVVSRNMQAMMPEQQ